MVCKTVFKVMGKNENKGHTIEEVDLVSKRQTGLYRSFVPKKSSCW